MSAPAKLDLSQAKPIDSNDEKVFTVCVLSLDKNIAPVLVPKKVGAMAADGCPVILNWEDGRHLCYHRVKGTTGINRFASMLANKPMFGEVYIVMTAADHLMIDFSQDVFDLAIKVYLCS